MEIIRSPPFLSAKPVSIRRTTSAVQTVALTYANNRVILPLDRKRLIRLADFNSEGK